MTNRFNQTFNGTDTTANDLTQLRDITPVRNNAWGEEGNKEDKDDKLVFEKPQKLHSYFQGVEDINEEPINE